MFTFSDSEFLSLCLSVSPRYHHVYKKLLFLHFNMSEFGLAITVALNHVAERKQATDFTDWSMHPKLEIGYQLTGRKPWSSNGHW